ncbi:uncharacterized protein LOC62_06G007950 [Vanrija pseudolonga]|uniref:SET domain-containing protein n=1 Tax=Vanrija pseudolonga TaxID=143232 RepID=A0AAF1BKB1_9TREE|nr:hypothetical protein LOC62_06G007950 [Vanrija pseudolonga]
MNHGLLVGAAPPSRALLNEYLDATGVWRNDAVSIGDMADGGWRAIANRDMELGETICKIPKQALLSVRTADLRPPKSAGPGTTSHAILSLALALLNELRLGPDSGFWGYVQSLPRETVPIPALWPLYPDGSDARLAEKWLKGTEAERDLRRREGEGVGLVRVSSRIGHSRSQADMRTFYDAGKLPATRLHPERSPFEAFAHAFSLVSTRAFIIDLHHTIALCPFADVLNHAASSHTSLASDDFVCHVCGSLAPCAHDGGPNPARLAHLHPNARARIDNELDTVDMYVERCVAKGDEVMNSYGEGIGEARLLVEWGFVPPEDDADDDEEGFLGDGITWSLSELCDAERAAQWQAMDEGDDVDVEADDGALLAPRSAKNGVYHLNHSGQASVRLFGALWLANSGSHPSDDVRAGLKRAVRSAEAAWEAHVADDDPLPLDSAVLDAIKGVVALLERRRAGLPAMSVDELYAAREALVDAPLQSAALTVAINEVALVQAALERWSEFAKGLEG